MKDPFKKPREPIVAIANAALPVLLERLGGTATVSDVELAAIAERYGGSVGVKGEIVAEGVYRLTLVPTKARPAEGPVS